MTATPLGTYQRYWPVGTRQWYWVPTIADPTAPTRIELDAGTDLTGQIVDGGVSGFALASDTIDVSDAGSDFMGKLKARSHADNSSIKLFLSKDGQDARTLLNEADLGYIVVFPEGDRDATPALTMDVWSSMVLTPSQIDESMSEAGAITYDFAHPSKPVQHVPVPTGA